MILTNIKVYPQGFNPRSIQRIELFLNKNNQHSEQDFSICNNLSQSDIILLDLDTVKNTKAINEVRQNNPQKPLVVLSVLHYKYNDPLIFSVKKPLNDSNFYQLLQQISLLTEKQIPPEIELKTALLEHIQSNNNSPVKQVNSNNSPQTISTSDKVRLSSYVGRQADIDIDKPQSVISILFDSKRLLLGSIQRGISRAKSSNKMLELHNFGHTFIIDPKLKTIHSFVSESVLRPLCLMTSNDVSVIKTVKKGRQDPQFINLLEQRKADVIEWRWDELLWKFSLWSARGKIPRETDLKLPVTLSHWPNFSRLQMFPHAMQIAAIMQQSPARLTDIAQQLGVEQRFVFAFYTAANAIGLAHNSRRQSDNLFKTEVLINGVNKELQENDSDSIINKMFSFLTGKADSKISDKQSGARK